MEKGAVIKHDISKAPKTGNWRNMEPEVDAAKCIGCQTCVQYCPEACIEMKRRTKRQMDLSLNVAKGKPVAKIDYEYCKGCGVCAQVCPVKAIAMKK